MTGCAVALELATPRLYRRNLFRVLGLPISSAPADVRRRRKRLDMQRRLGIEESAGQSGALPLDPPPSDDEIQSALERLGDPQARLLDEIFWIWPVGGGRKSAGSSDKALDAFSRGDIAAARKLWTQAASAGGKRGDIALHNLAVVNHALALDFEQRISAGKGTPTDPDKLERLWGRTLTQWATVMDSGEFWNGVRGRVKGIDDARLTTGFVRRIRETLPHMLLLVNARLALQAAERDDETTSRRHRTVLSHMEFSDGQAADALWQVLKPIRERVKAILKTAEEASAASPRSGRAECRRIIDDTAPLLRVIDRLLVESDPIRRGLHDDIAEAALECQIAYGNRTKDWRSCVEIGDTLRKIVSGDAARTRLDRNLEIARENHEFLCCHFCRQGQSTEGSAIEVKMWGNLRKHVTSSDYLQTNYEVNWNHGKFNVPRCPRCRNGHYSNIAVFLAAILLVTLVAMWATPRSDFLALLALVGLPLGAVLAQIYCRSAPWGFAWNKRKFATVREKLDDDWVFGEGPSEEQKQAAPIVQLDRGAELLARLEALRAQLGN